MRKVVLLTTFVIIIPPVFLFLLIFSLFLSYQKDLSQGKPFGEARNVAYAALPASETGVSGSISQEDGRVERIRQFLAYYHSPLEPYAQNIVDEADSYNLDFRLIPAIAMQESNLCKKSPKDSFNCWGFGIYGGKITRFTNYPEAIHTVTKTLATKYKKDGLDTPNEIMKRYTPSSNGSWAYGVNTFMDVLQ